MRDIIIKCDVCSHHRTPEYTEPKGYRSDCNLAQREADKPIRRCFNHRCPAYEPDPVLLRAKAEALRKFADTLDREAARKEGGEAHEHHNPDGSAGSVEPNPLLQ